MFLLFFRLIMKKLFLSFIFLVFLFSCADGAGSSEKEHGNGPLKLIITNKTDYEVTEIYYKQTDYFDSANGFGIELLKGNALPDKDRLIFCPEFVNHGSNLPYYFTFVRQKGSTDNKFYITTDVPVYLNRDSGIVSIDLLPYNFYSARTKNEEKICNDGTRNGE